MAVKETIPFGSINLFTASKQIRFLSNLKGLRFSGELVLTAPQGQQWIFYLYQGSIMYASGGTHPVRRWQRNIAAYCPQFSDRKSALPRNLAGIDANVFTSCWEYQLLSLGVAQQKIAPEQAAPMIRAVVVEVLFDVAQAMRATYQIKPGNLASTPLVLIDVEDAISQVQQLWQTWQNERLTPYSPNKVPIVKQPDYLRERTSAQAYQSLIYLLNGQRTLRDVAVVMKRDVLQVTRSLLPFIQADLVQLINIPDLPIPVNTSIPDPPVTTAIPKRRLVACVDDSPLVCQTMEALLTGAGYRFVGVQDGLRAIGTMLARKPDVIFLDLVMPFTNGYEICSQLRKLSLFRNTPILILTGSDGVVDRVRAKLVGASDFLSKPVDGEKVLSVIHKHLQQGVTSS